jgi:hypothetical protein
MIHEIGILGLESVAISLLIAPTLNAASHFLDMWHRGKSKLAVTNAHLTAELEASNKVNVELLALHEHDKAEICALRAANLELEQWDAVSTNNLREEQREHSVTSGQLSIAMDQLNIAHEANQVLKARLENGENLLEERSEELAVAKGDAAYFEFLMDHFKRNALKYRAELTQHEEEKIQGWLSELRRTIRESLILHSVS